MRLALASLVGISLVAAPSPTPRSGSPRAAPPAVVPNDNRVPAGTLRGKVLTVRLEARVGEWQPAGDSTLSMPAAAFGEEGRALEIPGPLIRVRVGTEVRATVTNRLAKPMRLFGMGERRGATSDSVVIAPGATREMRFRATEPGTYWYAASTDTFPVLGRLFEDAELGGVIVVDPRDGPEHADERIIAITGQTQRLKGTRSGVGPRSVFVFNGRSWPNTERFVVDQGDSVRWRFVNIHQLDHPLHLHGFYFRVDAKGDGARDTTYAPDDRRMAVTELMHPGQTMRITWSPDRSGNWIFHCHFAGHISPWSRIEIDRTSMAPDTSMRAHMSRLVLGITVKPRGAVVQAGEATRKIRLLVRSHAKIYGDYVGYAFVLGGSPAERDTATMPVPGPTLELTRGERVAVTIVNQSHDQAAVHWHGIEVESYADGVPGWSGGGANILPMIAPGESLTVRFTPPRAGTFIYHSHSNEFQQIASGLYGALIVNEPGTRRDTMVDKVLLLSDGGPIVNFFDLPHLPRALLNGQADPAPLELRADVATRLRIINIHAEWTLRVSLMSGDVPARWRIVAKDGMPVPRSLSVERPATMLIGAGETYDVEVVPEAGAPMSLRYVPERPLGLPTTVVAVRVR